MGGIQHFASKKKMPPHPIPIFAAPDASIVPEAVPLDSDTESEGDVMEIQQQMDAKKKRPENEAKAQIVKLREKKQKEKADQKRQEELDRERKEEETWKEAEWKKVISLDNKFVGVLCDPM